MRHKFDEKNNKVFHEHNVEVNTEDLTDLVEKAGQVAVTVIVTYFVGDTLRHIFKKSLDK